MRARTHAIEELDCKGLSPVLPLATRPGVQRVSDTSWHGEDATDASRSPNEVQWDGCDLRATFGNIVHPKPLRADLADHLCGRGGGQGRKAPGQQRMKDRSALVVEIGYVPTCSADEQS